MAASRPTLLFVIGPGAVGKMTVGAEIARRTGFKLFHNHQTIDLLLQYFPFGSAPFGRLVGEFRRRIMEEAAGSDLPGLIFTYVWAFGHPTDEREVEGYASIFRERGGAVYYVELQAPQSVRLERDQTPFRLEQKPTKRDPEISRRRLMDMDASYQLDSGDRFAGRDDYLKIDNTMRRPAEVAELVIARFGLPLLAASPEPTS
jgi:hypothetical protein